MSDLGRQLCDLASRLAVAAGEFVLEGRTHGVKSASSKSSATDIVTEFDRASERMIVEGLLTERPDDAIVGEEGTAESGLGSRRWWIDGI
ncbi:MAG: monophosphatase, partial [Ilumatobacteraceae bacterium]